MHPSHLVWAGAMVVVASLWLGPRSPSHHAAAVEPLPTEPPAAVGHYVLVVEGDRNVLDITHASHKTDPFGGVPKGLESTWQLTVRDAAGTTLSAIPLDVTPFATDPLAARRGVVVEGCIVRDPRIGMLVSVPAHPTAASYTFTRAAGEGREAVLGVIEATKVQTLAGGR